MQEGSVRKAVNSSRNVLIPIDGSKHSLRALRHVVLSAAADGRPITITLLNVQPRVLAGSLITRDMVNQHYEVQSKAALARARRLMSRHKLDAAIRVLIGDPAQTIAEAARKWGCSEIVMGTRGLGTLRGLLLGSVVTKVIQLSRVPVTVVP
jgi:nucleotide-binding universal stress UspA family protein